MSADNWTVCPRCRNRAQRHLDAERAGVYAQYGKVSIEEFDRLRDALPDGVALSATFREDYEIYGAEEGTVCVSYEGRCQECGLSLQFRHEHEFPEWIEGDES